MHRPQFHDPLQDLPPIERELHDLREENRRMKGLLEIREDRTEMERYNIQSRNKLMALMGLIMIVLIGSWVVFAIDHASWVRQNNDIIYKLHHAAVYVPENQ